MSSQRRACLESLKNNSGCEVKVITPQNLNEYILPNHPLHKAYQYLSLTHKSDYLRCYFMHHHGGGYSDIKETSFDWAPYFPLIEENESIWAVGYQEVGPEGVAHGVENYDLLSSNFDQLIGNCAFICKPYSPLTSEWINELHARLDILYEKLETHPAKHPQDAYLKPSETKFFKKLGLFRSQYPIPWSYILGDIFQTLAFKYRQNISKELPQPEFSAPWR